MDLSAFSVIVLLFVFASNWPNAETENFSNIYKANVSIERKNGKVKNEIIQT